MAGNRDRQINRSAAALDVDHRVVAYAGVVLRAVEGDALHIAGRRRVAGVKGNIADLQLQETGPHQRTCAVQFQGVCDRRESRHGHRVRIDHQGECMIGRLAGQHQPAGIDVVADIDGIAGGNHGGGVASLNFGFQICQHRRPVSADSGAIDRGDKGLAVDRDGVGIAVGRQRAAVLNSADLLDIQAWRCAYHHLDGDFSATRLVGAGLADMGRQVADIAAGRTCGEHLQIQRPGAADARIEQFNGYGGSHAININRIAIQVGMGLAVVGVMGAIQRLDHINSGVELINHTSRIHRHYGASRFLRADRCRCFHMANRQVLASIDGDEITVRHIADILDNQGASGLYGDVAGIGNHMLDRQAGGLIDADIARNCGVHRHRADQGVELHAVGGGNFQLVGNKHRSAVGGNRSRLDLKQANTAGDGLAGRDNAALELERMVIAQHIDGHIAGRIKAAQAADKAGQVQVAADFQEDVVLGPQLKVGRWQRSRLYVDKTGVAQHGVSRNLLVCRISAQGLVDVNEGPGRRVAAGSDQQLFNRAAVAGGNAAADAHILAADEFQPLAGAQRAAQAQGA